MRSLIFTSGILSRYKRYFYEYLTKKSMKNHFSGFSWIYRFLFMNAIDILVVHHLQDATEKVVVKSYI